MKQYLTQIRGLKKAILFDVQQVFDTATSYTGIFIYSINNSSISYSRPKTNALNGEYTHQNSYDEPGTLWMFLGEGKDDSLSGLLIKLLSQKNTLKNYVVGIYQGVVTTGDDIFFVRKTEDNKSTSKFYSSRLNKYFEIENSLLKPALKGENIRRYSDCHSDLFLIYPHFKDENSKTVSYAEDQIRKLFPLGYNYLLNFKGELVKRKIQYKTNPLHWYALHRSRQINIFESIKILTPQLQNLPNFMLDVNKWYPDAGGYSVVLKNNNTDEYKYFLALLNSKVLFFFIKSTSNAYNNNYYYFKTNYLEPFPVPNTNQNDKKLLVELVSKILRLTSQKDYINNQSSKMKVISYENEIDQLVYEIYGLTEEEIRILESSISSKKP